MIQRYSAPAWLLWAAASAFIVLVTRNPVYLCLLLASVLAVYLSLEHRSPIALAWGTVLRIGLVIAGISVLFNVLTVHTGDRPFASLPDSWPIIGGSLTWNAALYGAISGLALFSLLLIAATFSTAVDRSALVRMMPRSMATIAVAAAAALSMFPQTILAIRQVREAHKARGLLIRSPRDVQRLLVPVLFIGLERAFNLAESMESRGFGNRTHAPSIPSPVLIGTLILGTTGVVLVSIGHVGAGAVMLLGSVGLIALATRHHGSSPVPRFRVSRLTSRDIPVVGASLLVFGLVSVELMYGASLHYSTYPSMQFPDVSPLVLVATILPFAPRLRRETAARVELADA